MRTQRVRVAREYGSSTGGVISSTGVMEAMPSGIAEDAAMADECSHCREELARLHEENAALRRAAIAFGSLAERLNATLQEERRARQQRTAHEGSDARNDWNAAPQTVRRSTGIQG